jgi:hypothetical protein
MPIDFESSAELRWLGKEVLESRLLDGMTDPGSWTFSGTGALSFLQDAGPGGTPALRVDMEMFTTTPAPTRSRLSSVNLRRAFAGEDWTVFNRLSMWFRADVRGFPMLPLQIVLHNEGEVAVPDVYGREGVHYVTLDDGAWHHVVWEIEPLARDRVTMLEVGYWVNKMLAEPGDSVAFEIGRIELQRVEPDHYVGWSVAPGRIAFSHTGYEAGLAKTAVASDLAATEFELIRVDDTPLGEVVLRAPVRSISTRLGRFQEMDFSAATRPGRYVLAAGGRRTRPFAIRDDVWRETVLKALNFFYGERCGYPVPGAHGVDHQDWRATHGDQSIVMNGGWHDAGDLSQGMVNTGEATYAMFALAERLQERGDDPALLARVLEEARWGLDWVMKVRFDGGYRIGFAGNNLWTNGIIGDADDRTREALNNPNVNYIAAAAGAIAYRVLRETEPELAARALRIARDDWRHAIAGVESPETWSTPAFAASPMELAGIGILASLELYEATGERRYADRAVELARVVVGSQEKSYIGSDLPLAGFFYTGPDRREIFHQFHRGNDQAPIVAMARLIKLMPQHPDWMDWYAVVALYSEYQKASARTTAPYEVLPAYVYHDTEHLRMSPLLDRYQATPEAYRQQVLTGLPMGDGYYLRAFPVWFARRGNYGVLLSQAKALSTAARVRGDSAAAALAQAQAQWVVGRNPFAQSTMYGEGYDWAQQYSVSTGDLVGSLPVGMQSHGVSDLPYWPAQNTYVYKEVWVHSTSRWIWLMEDLLAGGDRAHGRGATGSASTTAPAVTIRSATHPSGEVTIEISAAGEGEHTFAVRAENLVVRRPERTVTLRPGEPTRITWSARVRSAGAPWVAVVVPDGAVDRRLEVVGYR